MAREPSVNLTQAAYERLHADLLSCRIPPGQKLKIQDLCTRYEVSLGAIREALARLTSEGLVVAEPQRGFRAAPISAEDLKDLTMARIEVDSICIRMAIEHGDIEWESDLVAAFHRLKRTPERALDDPDRTNDDWATVHSAFHYAVVAGCKSPWLLRLHNQLYAQSERYRRLSIPLDHSNRPIEDEHKAIMEAMLARDTDRALELIRIHLDTTAHILLPLAVEAAAAS